MLLSAVSVLVVAQSSSEIPEGLMNNPVHFTQFLAQIPPTNVIVHYNLEHPNVFGILLEGSRKAVVILKLNFVRQ